MRPVLLLGLLLTACLSRPAAPPPRPEADPQAARGALERLERALASSQPETVTLSGEEVTAILEEELLARTRGEEGGSLRLRGAAVAFRGSLATVYLDLAEPLSVQVVTSGSVHAREGLLSLSLTSARLGPLPLPGLLVERLESLLNERLARAPLPRPVARVEVRDGLLVLTLKGEVALIEEAVDPRATLRPVVLPQLGLSLELPADHRLETQGSGVRVILAGGHLWLEVHSLRAGTSDPAVFLSEYLLQLGEEGGWNLLRGPFELPVGSSRGLAVELGFSREGRTGDVLYVVVGARDRLLGFGAGPAAVSSPRSRALLERILTSVALD